MYQFQNFTKRMTAACKKAKPAAAVFSFALVTALLHMTSHMVFMEVGWENFKSQMTAFFQSGLGGPGMEGIGIAIAVIGVAVAAISFVVHKFNPQSRMPGWVTCLGIGLVGALAMGGVGKPIELLVKARDVLYGWFGI